MGGHQNPDKEGLAEGSEDRSWFAGRTGRLDSSGISGILGSSAGGDGGIRGGGVSSILLV